MPIAIPIVTSIVGNIVTGIRGDDGAPPPGSGNLLDFQFLSSLNGAVDGAPSTANFSRTSAATFTDFENEVIAVLPQEARFQGARRVRNLHNNVSDVGGAVTIDNGDGTFTSTGLIPGNSNRIAMRSQSGVSFFIGLLSGGSFEMMANESSNIGKSISFRLTNTFGGGSGPIKDLILTDTMQRVETDPKDIASTGIIEIWMYGSNSNNATGVIWRRPQLEIFSGSQNSISEYVEHDQQHGANVNGVKYFLSNRSNQILLTQGILVEDITSNQAQGNDNDVVTLSLGFYTAWLRTTNGSGGVIISAGATLSPSIVSVSDDTPVTFEVTGAGDVNFNNANTGVMKTDSAGNALKQIASGKVHKQFIDFNTIKTADVLNVDRPSALLQPSVNDFEIEIDTISLSDLQDTSNTLIDIESGGSDNLRVRKQGASSWQNRKFVGGSDYTSFVASGSQVLERKIECEVNSITGVTMRVNGVDGNPNQNTDPLIGFDAGDGVVHIGSLFNGNDYLNAMYKNFTVK